MWVSPNWDLTHPRRCFVACLWLLLAMPGDLNAQDSQRDAVQDARELASSIVQECYADGLLGCDSKMLGMERLFAFIRLADESDRMEAQWVEFIERRYGTKGRNLSAIGIHLKVNPGASFDGPAFVESISSAIRLHQGFEIRTNRGETWILERVSQEWRLRAVGVSPSQFDGLAPFESLAFVKISALKYRMLEAEMANLDQAEVEHRLIGDLAPFIVLFSGDQNARQWAAENGLREPKEVLEFFGRLNSVDDAKNAIRLANGLSE